MKVVKVIMAVVLVAALAGGVVLVRQTQETRRGAYLAKVGVNLLPDTKNIRVGESLAVKVKMTAGEQKVSAVNFGINYPSETVEVVGIKVNESAFNTVSVATAVNGAIKIVALSTRTTNELATGVIDVATLIIKGKNNGTAKLNFDSGYEIVGWNASGGDDKQLEANLNGASYVIGDGAGTTTVDLAVIPNEKTIMLGEKLGVEVKLKTGETRVSAAKIKIKFDSAKLEAMEAVKGEVFDSAPILSVDNSRGIIEVGVLSMKTSNQLPKGDVTLISFKLKGKATGTSKVRIDSSYEIVGLDGGITLGRVTEGNYAVVSGVTVIAATPTTKPTAKPTVPTPTSGSGVKPTTKPTATPTVVANGMMADFELRSASGTVEMGKKTKVGAWLKTGTTGISGVGIKINFDKTKFKITNLTKGDGFDAAPILTVDESNGVIKASVLAMKASSQLPKGEVKIVDFDVEGVAEGNGEIKLDGSYEISGYSANKGSGNVGLENIGKGIYTVIEGTSSSEEILNLKIAYGKLAGDAKCVTDWPLQVTVMSGETSKVYSDIKTTRDTSITDRAVFKATLPLTGWMVKDNVAVFIKSVKHLQMKYGTNNQTESYDKAGGEIKLDSGVVYDFSGWSLLPGDITGVGDVPDGRINGLDFSRVKQKSLTHETVAEGGYILEDLDGNCQVNSNDVTVLKMSLNEKQETLY